MHEDTIRTDIQQILHQLSDKPEVQAMISMISGGSGWKGVRF